MAGASSKKIGLYGGTFDPIHCGHINLAIELQEKHGLDEIWFIPTNLNPFKVDQERGSSSQDRLEMLRLAIHGIPCFKIKDLELQREPPSYTIDTLRELIYEDVPGVDYYLLLGQDTVPGFFQWKLVNDIVAKVQLLVASRSGVWHDAHFQGCDPQIIQAIQKGITKTRYMDISSTEIRQRIRAGLYCGHLLPAVVLNYIYAHKLYELR